MENVIYSVESLAQQWAKKYLQRLHIANKNQDSSHLYASSEITSPEGREKTVQEIRESLRSVSAKTWNKTEMLLSSEIKQHCIHFSLINPWEIAADSFNFYEKVLNVYTQSIAWKQSQFVTEIIEQGDLCDKQILLDYTKQVTPSHLSTLIGAEISATSIKYTNDDPRVIGFVSMQFHSITRTY